MAQLQDGLTIVIRDSKDLPIFKGELIVVVNLPKTLNACSATGANLEVIRDLHLEYHRYAEVTSYQDIYKLESRRQILLDFFNAEIVTVYYDVRRDIQKYFKKHGLRQSEAQKALDTIISLLHYSLIKAEENKKLEEQTLSEA